MGNIAGTRVLRWFLGGFLEGSVEESVSYILEERMIRDLHVQEK